MDRLKKAFESDKVLRLSWHLISDANLVSIIAKQGFDACLLDMQHGLHTETSVIAGIAAVAASGKCPLVRVPVRRWDMVERALDFGALGVVAPMVNNREDAENFASAAKYPPMGSRSYGPAKVTDVYQADGNAYVASANANTFALAMIETREAFENLDDILAVEGIDGILLGPGDFSISMRQNPVPDVYGPDTISQIEEMARKTLAAGKIPTAFTGNSDHFNLAASLGFKLISISTDTGFAVSGAKALIDEISD